MKEVLIKITYFMLGILYSKLVYIFNRWYRKNRNLFQEFIVEYKKLNKRQRKVVKKNA